MKKFIKEHKKEIIMTAVGVTVFGVGLGICIYCAKSPMPMPIVPALDDIDIPEVKTEVEVMTPVTEATVE